MRKLGMPVLAALAAIVVVRVIDRVERYEGWRSLIRPDTAQAVLMAEGQSSAPVR